MRDVGTMDWKWEVTGYYAATVLPPKTPNAVALQVRHKTDSGKDMEVTAFNSRPDIGSVVVRQIGGFDE